jgi:cytochrome c553
MIRSVAVVILFSTIAAPASAELLFGDAAAGKRLHETGCVGCHDAGVYTRKDRKVHSLDGLIKQVNACNTQLSRSLGKDEIYDLVRYLNDSFYRYP